MGDLRTTLLVFQHASSTSACLWIIQLHAAGALRKDSEEAFVLNGLRRPKFPHNEMYFIRKQAPPTTPQRLSSQVG